jgi:hypothetical protein
VKLSLVAAGQLFDVTEEELTVQRSINECLLMLITQRCQEGYLD